MVPLLLGFLLGRLLRSDETILGALTRDGRVERYFHIYTLPYDLKGFKAVPESPASSYDIGVSVNGCFVKLHDSPWLRHEAYSYFLKGCL
jgi:hypothetical protein